ncbi:uncharacterized protein LOC131856779 [Cryptomeria japonica]|uniref:uncharacterized protein LOC131856779 n=1 Tax=Cryptomeria japonica TaxID=3369 RepID=UPI0027DA04DB|nr:uncharacterized protein LOC131856779 [Cryptomeria japonica]
MREPNIQRKKLTPNKPTPKVSDILSPEELINEITQDGNLSNISKCYHTFKDSNKGTIEESIILHLDIYKKFLTEVVDDLPNDLYLRLEEKKEEKNRQKIEKSFTKLYQKSDKGKNKVGGILDLTIKDNLPPPVEDTPPVVAEKQVEEKEKDQVKEQVEAQVEHEEEKTKEVNTENIDSESNILFTMNVDTHDINVIINKYSENVEEKKTEATTIEISESSINTVDSQQNIEKLIEAQVEAKVEVEAQTETGKGQEQSIAEPIVNKDVGKDENKIEKQSDHKELIVNKEEVNDEVVNVQTSKDDKKLTAEHLTLPSTSTMDYKPTNVIGVLLDSIKKITECNALTFKAIDDTLPILQQIAPTCKINEEKIRERVNKEKADFFNKSIEDCTRKLDSLISTLNSTILEFKELYRDVYKPHHLTDDIDDQIKQTQKEIDDIADNSIGSSELTSVLDQEMAVYEEKIENIEKEKTRLRLKAQELKNKLGPRLDNLLTRRNGLSKTTILGGRSLEEQMHHLTSMI